MERVRRENKTSQANLFTLLSVRTGGGRRWWGPEGGDTRHHVERRNATDTRTAYILQGFPSEHSKCPSGIPYVQQACGSTGEAVKQTSGTCRTVERSRVLGAPRCRFRCLDQHKLHHPSNQHVGLEAYHAALESLDCVGAQ